MALPVARKKRDAPIFVTDKIALEEAVVDKKSEEEDMARFKKYIETLKPSDFRGS